MRTLHVWKSKKDLHNELVIYHTLNIYSHDKEMTLLTSEGLKKLSNKDKIQKKRNAENLRDLIY